MQTFERSPSPFNVEPFVDKDCLYNIFEELNIEKEKGKKEKKFGNRTNIFAWGFRWGCGADFLKTLTEF